MKALEQISSGPGQATAELPIRDVIFTREELANHGRRLAEQQQSQLVTAGGKALLHRFLLNAAFIKQAYFRLAKAAHDKQPLTPGAEWLLDNYHLVEDHVRDIRRHMPKRFYRELPKLSSGAYEGYPRVYCLACEVIAHTDAVLDSDQLAVFVRAYQERLPLSIGELWALPVMLRLALIENLRRLAEASLRFRDQTVMADDVIGPMLVNASGTDLLIVIAQVLQRRPEILAQGTVQILRMLRGKGPRTALALQWVEERVREAGLDPDELIRLHEHAQAANQISFGNTFISLKTVSTENWRDWFEALSSVDAILRQDPGGVFNRSDFETRDHCRRKIEWYARRLKTDELRIAQIALTLAQENIGTRERAQSDPGADSSVYYLIGRGREIFERRIGFQPRLADSLARINQHSPMLLYLGIGTVIMLALWSFIFSYCLQKGAEIEIIILALALTAIPLSDLMLGILQWCLMQLLSPKALPKLDFEKGVPESARTIVTVHAIFSDKELIEKVIDGIEVRHLANEDPNIAFALLADLFDADSEVSPRDQDLLDFATERISILNKRYASENETKFFLLFRSRIFNPAEGKWMGWERKRGKIEEFNRLLLGTAGSLKVYVGSAEALQGFRYVLTLDADTRLSRGVAAEMIGTIAHPLNHAVIDPERRLVVKGYGIIQPRIGITLESANLSRFSRIFCGSVGLDPYTGVVSEVYQDFFGESSFVGKAIYCPKVFHQVLDRRVPENALLSHDLFEGNYARVGLASDIELLDDFPAKFEAYARRDHRWVRGDWQLLPWVLNAKSEITALGRWKLIDNLRRSLVPPSIVALLAAGWTILPGSGLFWTLAVLLVLAFPVYMNVATVLFVPTGGASFVGSFKGIGKDALRQVGQVILTLCFMPFEAWVRLHAMLVTLYRLFISKRHLLEWQTSHQTERRSGAGYFYYFRFMFPGLLITVLVLISVSFYSPSRLIVAAPILLLWLLAPVVAELVSRPPKREVHKLNEADRTYLKEVAWETWSYFDELLVPEYNYLIPDNVQMVPKRLVAPRTSPTNIGLSILAVFSANDLGFISSVSVIKRLGLILENLLKLERVNGHFLNWYDVTNLQPLLPRYLSTVDSGNLVGHLIAARVALAQIIYLPIVNAAQIEHLNRIAGANWAKATDTLALADSVELAGTRLVDLLARRRRKPDDLFLRRAVSDLEQFVALEELTSWVKPLKELFRVVLAVPKAEKSKSLLTSIESLEKIISARTPSLSLFSKIIRRAGECTQLVRKEIVANLADSSELVKMLDELESDLARAEAAVKQSGVIVDRMLKDTTKIINEADFGFLFDSHKKLFVIGHNLDLARRDPSFYDLLASEARLASLVAIAKGDVPLQHWFVLGRSLADTPGGRALMSWSGTMFEYLMPLLVTQDYPHTLLSETHRAVVKAQRLYGRRRGVPWGISESAYSGVDFEKNYQYRAFGVPGLGLKRGLSEDLVISPYSTALAVTVDPRAALRNFRRFDRMGLRGEHGFYEAVDYTSSRLTSDEKFHVVRSFLAHHQGMSLTAINNLLNSGIMQRRFHADPLVRSADLLLQEKFPDRVQLTVPNKAELSTLEREELEQKAERIEVITGPHTQYPITRLVSNGRYSVVVDNAGGGWSFFDRDISISRWKEDATQNNTGYFIFLRDLDSGKLWSVAYQPTRVEPETYEVVFNPEKVEFKRKDFGLGVHTEITVSPEDNVEVRRVTITNISQKKRNIEVTSFFEVVLGGTAGDLAHPAFAKMFVQSEYNANFDALIFSRRPRSVHDKPWYLMHMLTMPVCWDRCQYESSREAFIGRGKNIHDPQASQGGYRLSGSQGLVLDPVAALRTRIEVEPGRAETCAFITGVAQSLDEINHLAQRYHELHAVSRAFEMAWSKSNVELRHQHFAISQTHSFQHLANALLYNIDHVRGRVDAIAQNRLTQSGFWRFGVSGDLPIVLVRLTDPTHVKLLQEVMLAHEYLKRRGLVFDLLVLNEYPGGYLQNFQQELDALIHSGYSGHMVDKPGGIYLRTSHQLSFEEQNLLKAVARVVLEGEAGTMAQQLKLSIVAREPSVAKRGSFSYLREPEYAKYTAPAKTIEFSNGYGGFTDKGKAYQLLVGPDKVPPSPWSNVVANPRFGFLVTESGGGYTWASNSRENRLTPWSNDPVSDPLGEALYLRDVASGAYWSATPKPVRSKENYCVTHGIGFTEFTTQQKGIFSSLKLAVGGEDPVKVFHLRVSNGDYVERKIEIYLYVELVLGILRGPASRQVVTEYDRKLETIFAKNTYNNEFAPAVAFLNCSRANSGFTCSRQEFIGRHRDLSSPEALELGAVESLMNLISAQRAGVRLSGKLGQGIDPCAVLQIPLTLAPGAEQELVFSLGEGVDYDEAHALALKYRSFDHALSRVSLGLEQWKQVTNAIEVTTPDRSFDLLINGWLLYQTMSCRLWGRSGFYQSGGAYGFRDQLQDVLALLYIDPQITKKQILLHASRQFVEGDVQHWWHPPTGRGVRTRISDDYLWLPLAVQRYTEVTGDYGILDQEVSFIEAAPLEEGREDSYIVPEKSNHPGTLYEHCVIAIDRALNLGAHGLPLIGSGDWNDGMNEVGRAGKGESVWLAWFICKLLKDFEPCLKRRNDHYRVKQYSEHASALAQAIETSAWDGNWYRRAFFDDGQPLGSSTNDECKIDSLAQTWSIISGVGDRQRSVKAMESVEQHLVEDNLIKLLTPPFDRGSLQPGYIKGYLPGIRENGGQYTHAATWVVLATALQGRGTRAMELFSMINPINHGSTKEKIDKYKGEPYVLCGDVYSVPPYVGRAGWSWYTGSASWMYRVALENLLGLDLRGDGIRVSPCIPASWPGFQIKCNFRGCSFQIDVSNPDKVERGVKELRLNGKIQSKQFVGWEELGTNGALIEVVMG